MALPSSFTRTISVTNVSDPALAADRLERGLQSLKAKQVIRKALVIEFRGGLFRAVPNYNLLVPITAGRLEIAPCDSGICIRYRLEFLQLLVGVSVMIGGVFGPLFFLFLSAQLISWPAVVPILLAFWLWLFGANVAITLVRFSSWLRRRSWS